MATQNQPGGFAPPAPDSGLVPNIRTLDDRLSLPLAARLALAGIFGSVSGLILGVGKGGQDSGLRFQAENAHRLPNTQTGWYLYHKSKNYNMMFGGITEGVKQAGRLGLWAVCFFVLEEGIDRGRAAGVRMWRRVSSGEFAKGAGVSKAVEDALDAGVEERQVAGNRDCVSSMLAGLGSAGIFSAWNKLPLPTVARTAKMGAKVGLVFGLTQDALNVVKGKRVGYVEFIKRHTVGESVEAQHAEEAPA
ncbi:hypothetical protein PRZ48_005398 [Zasmidium cellare]|uniref:Uncharacterized protein n=1 Tax=Zasmidium cellare TaxID=395010 RepID=A0ABR0ESA7_ZASCE|nr:hypothetical protein PRZ48_005398 [Zasmidium cellare]